MSNFLAQQLWNCTCKLRPVLSKLSMKQGSCAMIQEPSSRPALFLETLQFSVLLKVYLLKPDIHKVSQSASRQARRAQSPQARHDLTLSAELFKRALQTTRSIDLLIRCPNEWCFALNVRAGPRASLSINSDKLKFVGTTLRCRRSALLLKGGGVSWRVALLLYIYIYIYIWFRSASGHPPQWYPPPLRGGGGGRSPTRVRLSKPWP